MPVRRAVQYVHFATQLLVNFLRTCQTHVEYRPLFLDRATEHIVEKPMSELIEEASEQTESGRRGVDKCSDVARFHLVHRVTLRRTEQHYDTTVYTVMMHATRQRQFLQSCLQ